MGLDELGYVEIYVVHQDLLEGNPAVPRNEFVYRGIHLEQYLEYWYYQREREYVEYGGKYVQNNASEDGRLVRPRVSF